MSKKIFFCLFLSFSVFSPFSYAMKFDNPGQGQSYQRVLLGPAYTQSGDEPDFIIGSRGVLTPSFYNYGSTSPYAGCVLRTPNIVFGTQDTISTRIQLGAFFYADWYGAKEDFYDENLFDLVFRAKVRKPGCTSSDEACIENVVQKKSFFISSLHYIEYSGAISASTKGNFLWESFNPFVLSGSVESGYISICNVSKNNAFFISALEVQLSHTY